MRCALPSSRPGCRSAEPSGPPRASPARKEHKETRDMQRKHFLRATLAALALAAASTAGFAQTWPSRPVRMVLPSPPGATLDTIGRLLAQKLGEQTGQTFIVENRAGGNGIIGADVVS